MASATITETITKPNPMETVQMKLQPKWTNQAPHPPTVPKPRSKLRIDPQRALEPARKKLSTLESQRIMAVLVECIKKSETVIALPIVMDNLDRYQTMLGAELTKMLEEHKMIISTFNEMQVSIEELIENEQKQNKDPEDDREGRESGEDSHRSLSSHAQNALHHLAMVAKQIQHSTRNILRLCRLSPTIITSILEDKTIINKRGERAKEMIVKLNELKDILMNMLLTTPYEETERNQYLREVTERERLNAMIIEKLEAELGAAVDDRDSEIKKKNDVIRRLQNDLHQIEKFSEENIRRTKTEAEKQEGADMKNSEGKKLKLQQELSHLKSQFQNQVGEHRESESNLRKKKYKIETEVENWIQKYDADMGERQDEYEDIDAIYTEEKKQLNELEERFKTLEEEYVKIQEERRITRARIEAAERELKMAVKAATTIQAFWRSYKVRKAVASKKKKGAKKGKKRK